MDHPESQDNSSKITRRFSSPVTDSSRVLRLCQPSAGVRGTTEGSLAERLSVRFGHEPVTIRRRADPTIRNRNVHQSMRTLSRERRYSCAVFLATGAFVPANAGRRSEAHGQLEQRAAAGRCNGQSSKGSIEGNEERTGEEISRRIKRKGETEREKKKKETRRE